MPAFDLIPNGQRPQRQREEPEFHIASRKAPNLVMRSRTLREMSGKRMGIVWEIKRDKCLKKMDQPVQRP